MASFKLTIADPKDGKAYQREVKDAEAAGFIGLNIGEPIKGEGFGLDGYEFVITGGSDFCGFPMRKGILGVRKQITSVGGVGFPGLKGGKKLRRTVCGHKINDSITQINLKVTKAGAKKLESVSGGDAAEGKEDKAKDAPADKKAEAKEEKAADKKEEAPKDAPAKEEKPKEEAKAEEKPKEESPKEEKPKE
tara:strand:+ start:135 stop:710 length:576 start_codon:yes stop_codon:yes gene_type:complete